MDQSVEGDGLAALGGEGVRFVGFSVDLNGFSCLFPCHDAAFEIDDFVAFGDQHLSSSDGAPSATAIHGDCLVGGKGGLRLLNKVVLLDVDVDGVWDVPFVVLRGGSHVEQDHVGVCRQFSETVDIGVLEMLLAAGRCQS